MMKTLFLHPPSFDGFDGGAGSRYQARREIRSFWYPTWLAQPAALVPGSRLIDAPPARLRLDDVLPLAGDYELVVMHTSTPSFASDVKVAEALKDANPGLADRAGRRQGRGRTGSQPRRVARDRFRRPRGVRFHLPRGRARGATSPRSTGSAIAMRAGGIVHNRARAVLEDMDRLPFVTEVYKRDLRIEDYFIGYLKHPYVSLYTGRGCRSKCTFCLWPQTVGGHRYRVRSVAHVIEEIRLAKSYFPQVQGILFRRRHLYRRPAARRGDRPRTRQARRHLVVQRQGQRAARDARSAARQRFAAVACRLRDRQPADPATTSRRGCASTSPAASRRIATSSASRSTAPSSWACPARPRRRSRRRSASPPRSIRTRSRCRWRRPIPAPNCTGRRSIRAGSTSPTPN